MKKDYLADLRDGAELNTVQQLRLIIQLSIPAILAQLSTVIMQYIDASMVGRLGAESSAAIGLVSSTTWLMGGLMSAAAIGFSVQVAQRIGAKDEEGARSIVRQGLAGDLLFSLILLTAGVSVSGVLPEWLGGTGPVREKAASYFLIYCLGLWALQIRYAAGGMLQASGNMKVPGVLNMITCLLDVIFNFFFIFPTREAAVCGFRIMIPGVGMGVSGAALGTALSEVVCAALMLYFLMFRSPMLRHRKGERLIFRKKDFLQAARISVPVGLESLIIGSAYVMGTRIVSPLGNISLAANSFAVTAEGLCYMPGFGIGAAATTLIGQSIGARRTDLTRRLAWMTIRFGMAVMTCTGILMYIFAPQMIGILTPDPEIRELGAQMLRIEAFAEPMFAASIVASGVFRGAGDTLVPSLINLFSMWAVRLTLAAFLAPGMGLKGVWIAMCIELWVRGLLFLLRMVKKNPGMQAAGPGNNRR